MSTAKPTPPHNLPIGWVSAGQAGGDVDIRSAHWQCAWLPCAAMDIRSISTPRSRTRSDGLRLVPDKEHLPVVSSWRRRAVPNHINSVFDGFKRSLLLATQAWTNSMHSATEDTSSNDCAAVEWPYIWRSSAYACGISPQSSTSYMASTTFSKKSTGLKTDPCGTP